ncbi:hypothetical protein PF002_g511 [Phytophthora fragariae]|nr:hypothetical protein PF009_g1077 [Phytophthora fragariae]KAE9258033.1 hypothetical protein PF002_g511 [Phytophthora fragariae]KAE9329577.1 hypothetical protein PF001_g852 [Phytophthora fragariae]
MECVNTPEKVVEMAITFDKANKADSHVMRSFGNDSKSTGHVEPAKQNGSGGKKPWNKDEKREEMQRQHDENMKHCACFGCHKPGHTRSNCPNANGSGTASGGSGGGGARAASHFTLASGFAESNDGPAAVQDSSRVGRTEGTPERVGAADRGKPNWGEKPEYHPELWVLDSGANRHLVGDRRYFVNYRKLTVEERRTATVHGHSGKSSPVSVGSIDLWVVVNGWHVALRVDDVYYSPKNTNLLSQSVVKTQGFNPPALIRCI